MALQDLVERQALLVTLAQMVAQASLALMDNLDLLDLQGHLGQQVLQDRLDQLEIADPQDHVDPLVRQVKLEVSDPLDPEDLVDLLDHQDLWEKLETRDLPDQQVSHFSLLPNVACGIINSNLK